MIKFKKTKYIITAIVVSCLTILLIPSKVEAASAYSPKTTRQVYGKVYRFYSSVHNDSASTWAFGSVESLVGNVPTGYYGINARLYNSAGFLVRSSGWKYSDGYYAGGSAISGFHSTRGTFYGKSQVRLYNGNGYNTYTCNASPNVQRSALAPKIENKQYSVNDNGLSYGSNFYSESEQDEPDLVKVMGINGNYGYVYSSDLNKQNEGVDTPEEAVESMNNVKNGYTISVYDVTGVVVVDEFMVSGIN